MPIAVLACLPILAAAAGGTPYAVAFSQLTTSLKLTQTYLQVPKTAEAHYAWGYDEGKPRRMGGGMLMDEAGGVKASARDVAQWVQLNLQADQQLRLCCKQVFSARNSGTRNLRRCIRGWAGNAGLPGDINSSDSRDRA